MTKNQDKLSFGKLAVQLEFVTREQLAECTKIQRKIKELGVEPKKLGEVLRDKGYVTEEQVNHIFRVQGVKGGHTQITGYKIISRIGQGSMGYVYKALQISMDRIVAIKILSPKLGQNEKFVERFLREARSVARLNHPNIIQGIDVGESNGIYYFAMEYIDGPTIDKVIKKNGPLNEKKALKVMIQVARALEHAHKNNLVHRDIKPDNIFMTVDGTVRLGDFGIACELGDELRTTKCGTYKYMSPEMCQDERYDYTVDVWAIGVVTYWALTKEEPFRLSPMRGFFAGRFAIHEMMEAIKIAAYDHLSVMLDGDDDYEETNLSEDAKRFVGTILVADPAKRPIIEHLLCSAFLALPRTHRLVLGKAGVGRPRIMTALELRAYRKYQA
ncbi:MAG: serine/threonine protein kinase, partial [Planctomycetes bacterium]|nr:serine/threonine protein kinase [Planctomycetota bacterium]